MFEIPTILNSQEILDKAFRRAARVKVSDPDYMYRMKKLNKAKVDSAVGVMDSTLEKYVRSFPSFDNLSPFYLSLIELLRPVGEVKRALGRIDGARKQVVLIGTKVNRQIDRTTKVGYMDQKKREAFGRISSIIKALDKDLELLARAREDLKGLPSIPTKYPTAVVAGYPSVGKSRLVREMSTAKPKVASYPFTTQELTVGYFEIRRDRYQLVDTPGLLDRPFESRNPVEKQAVLALSELTNLCVFIIDPTGHCGFSLEPQIKLLFSIASSVPQMEIILLLNKSDLDLPEGTDLSKLDQIADALGDRLKGKMSISLENGEGLHELEALIVTRLSEELPVPWEDMSTSDDRSQRSGSLENR